MSNDLVIAERSPFYNALIIITIKMDYGLLETPADDFVLVPAYDLLNTRVHASDTDFALKKGLFADGSRSSSWVKTGQQGKGDFLAFAEKIGVSTRRVDRLLDLLLNRQESVADLVSRSFLSASIRKGLSGLFL